MLVILGDLLGDILATFPTHDNGQWATMCHNVPIIYYVGLQHGMQGIVSNDIRSVHFPGESGVMIIVIHPLQEYVLEIWMFFFLFFFTYFFLKMLAILNLNLVGLK